MGAIHSQLFGGGVPGQWSARSAYIQGTAATEAGRTFLKQFTAIEAEHNFSRGSEEFRRQAIQPTLLHGCLLLMQFWKQDDGSESASQHTWRMWGWPPVSWKALIQPIETCTPKLRWKKIRCLAAVVVRFHVSIFRDTAFTFSAGYLDFIILLSGYLDFIDPCAMLFVCTVC